MTNNLHFEHVAGYSRIDHVGKELVAMAESEMDGRQRSKRNMEAALRRACRKAKTLADSNPGAFGVFGHGLPRVMVAGGAR